MNGSGPRSFVAHRHKVGGAVFFLLSRIVIREGSSEYPGVVPDRGNLTSVSARVTSVDRRRGISRSFMR